MKELLHPHDKTNRCGQLFSAEEQRRWFLKMESTPGKDTMNIIELTTESLE